MAVENLDHVNIRTRDVPRSARFYAEVLGLDAAPSPNAMPGMQTQWLHDAGGHAVIHVRELDCEPGQTGSIDHIALGCSDLAGMTARLTALDVPFDSYTGMTVAGMTQLFLKDPDGVVIELVFREG